MKPFSVVVLLLLLLSLPYKVQATSTTSNKAVGKLKRGLLNVTRSRPRIVNGKDAPVGRYPYIVSIQRIYPQIKHFCGGSLIAPDIVLTAAHCYKKGESIAVRINPHTRDNPLPDSEIFPVQRSILHPLYESQSNKDHDFWIIQLRGQSKKRPLLRINDDPAVPVLNQSLVVAGWGVLEYGTVDLSDVLQHADENMTYISNEYCVNMTKGGDQGSYQTFAVTDDMMCALEPGQGSCQGDSGGPLFIRGNIPEEDIQVGIVSWGTDCGRPLYPGVFSRVSWGYEWIREQVCQLSSDPPNPFLCENEFVSSAPVVAPVQVEVLIWIQLDDYPTETGWTILDSRGDIVLDAPSGTYDANIPESIVTEVHLLVEDWIYTFILKDGFGDGISVPLGGAFVFLGGEEDYSSILVAMDGAFNFTFSQIFQVGEGGTSSITAPTLTPTVTAPPSKSWPPSFVPTMTYSPTVSKQLVTVLINFDTYSSVTLSWRITNTKFEVVKDVPQGTYTPFDGDQVIETVELELNSIYVFSIVDRNGLCCDTGNGYAAVFFGDSINASNVLVWDDGEFKFSSSQIFTLSSNATFERTLSPSPAPTISPAPTMTITPTIPLVNIVIRFNFDLFPSETGWQITFTDGDIVAEVPVGGYYLAACFDIVDEIVSVRADGLYTLTIIDKDGLCCKSGAGFVAVYYEEVSPDSVLLFLGGEFETESNGTFVASPFRKSDSSSPSRSPTGAPSSAPDKQTLELPSSKPITSGATSKFESLSKASMLSLGVSIVCSYTLL